MKKIAPSLMCRIGSRLDRGFTYAQFVDVTGAGGAQLTSLLRRGLIDKNREFYTPTRRGLAAMDKACDASHGRGR